MSGVFFSNGNAKNRCSGLLPMGHFLAMRRCQPMEIPMKNAGLRGVFFFMGDLLNTSGNIGKHLVNGGLKFNWLIFSLL